MDENLAALTQSGIFLFTSLEVLFNLVSYEESILVSLEELLSLWWGRWHTLYSNSEAAHANDKNSLNKF